MKKLFWTKIVFIVTLAFPAFAADPTADECIEAHPDICKATAVVTKVAAKAKAEKKKLEVICDEKSGAVLSDDGKYCLCPDPNRSEEENRFRPARMVAQKSRGLEIYIVEGFCGVTKTAFLDLEERVKRLEDDRLCSDTDPSIKVSCEDLRQKIQDAASDTDLTRLANEVEKVRKMAEASCHKDEKGKWVNCPDGGAARGDTVALVAMGEGFLRPKATSSFQLRLDAVWANYSGNDRDGFYLHGGAGVSFNQDQTRFGVAAGTGWVHDLSSDGNRGVDLRIGLGYRGEPTIGPNDVHAIGGEIAVDFLPANLLFLTVGVMPGVNVVQFYNDRGQRTDQRSKPLFYIAGHLGLGVIL